MRCDSAPDAPGMVRLLWDGDEMANGLLLDRLRSAGRMLARYDRQTRCWLVARRLLPSLASYFGVMAASAATMKRAA